jgi:hypothetical protein
MGPPHATLMLLQGVHPKVVSERLGHASVGITLDTYSHYCRRCRSLRSGGSTRCSARPNPAAFQSRARGCSGARSPTGARAPLPLNGVGEDRHVTRVDGRFDSRPTS